MAVLSSHAFSQERIAACIINQRTKRPIRVETLLKAYPDELADGRVHVANKVARALFDLIDARHPGAVLAAAKQYLPGFGQEDGATLTIAAKASAMESGVEISFRAPDHSRYTPEELAGDPLPGHSQPYSAKVLAHPKLLESVAQPIPDSLVSDRPKETVPAAKPTDSPATPVKRPPIRRQHLGHWVEWDESSYSWKDIDDPEAA